MFSKILIANRGEIACRAMRSAKKMGIATVAVYSDADKHALHVRQADEAVNIGGNTSAESYLSIENILKAIKDTNADAVHTRASVSCPRTLPLRKPWKKPG